MYNYITFSSMYMHMYKQICRVVRKNGMGVVSANSDRLVLRLHKQTKKTDTEVIPAK